MTEKKSLARVFADKYQYASKLQKVAIINEFISYTNYDRDYATRVLRSDHRKLAKHEYKRAPLYDDQVKAILEKIWKITDYLCGKRLVAILPEIIKKLIEFKEIKITEQIKTKLAGISAATIDRLLQSAKRQLGRKGTSMTRGTRYLIDQIPIKTFGEWQNSPVGHLQLDLVAHNGGSVYGGFLSTLNATDVRTSWTVCTLVRDKTMLQMLKGLFTVKNAFPFPIRGIHTDNGTEFISDPVLAFAKKYNLVFTRGRPYKKNDNPHIEQKNYSVLRRNTGYLRYDQPEHASTLRELYEALNLYVNYFQPTMILTEKHRVGAKSIRKYDVPKTPYQRLLDCEEVGKLYKLAAKMTYRYLNPAELKRKINICQAKLIRMAAPIRRSLEVVKIRRKKEMKHTMPEWRRHTIPGNPNPFLEKQRIEELRRAINLRDAMRIQRHSSLENSKKIQDSNRI